MADLFAPPSKEEIRQRRRNRLFEGVRDLKVLIQGLKYLNLENIDGLKILVRSIKYAYKEASDEEDIKKLWEEGLSQTISRLDLISNGLKEKYNDQIAELNMNSAFVALVKEIKQVGGEIKQGN